jgi:hypothetical protein
MIWKRRYPAQRVLALPASKVFQRTFDKQDKWRRGKM